MAPADSGTRIKPRQRAIGRGQTRGGTARPKRTPGNRAAAGGAGPAGQGGEGRVPANEQGAEAAVWGKVKSDPHEGEAFKQGGEPSTAGVGLAAPGRSDPHTAAGKDGGWTRRKEPGAGRFLGNGWGRGAEGGGFNDTERQREGVGGSDGCKARPAL